MLQINPKKFKTIKNKTIPNPLRPNLEIKHNQIYIFFHKEKFQVKKKIF